METVELCCAGRRRGRVTLRPEGQRVEIRAVMEDPGDGLYRLALVGQRGELPLGVLEPAGGELCLCRRLYCRDVEAVGRPLRGEARCSFRFGERKGWRESRCPAQLFCDPFLQSRLREAGRAWWRKEGQDTCLALPLEDGKPFPLEALFCLARIRRVEGAVCAVYRFNQEEKPVLD